MRTFIELNEAMKINDYKGTCGQNDCHAHILRKYFQKSSSEPNGLCH